MKASDEEEKSASLLAAVPIVQVHDKTQDEENSIASSKLLSGREAIKSQGSEKRELQVPSSLLNGSKSARVRLSERRSGSRKPQNRPAAFGETTAATSTDMVASMVNSLAGLASFKFTTENADSEGEVHNAWGENDTEDNLLERVHDLEQARGIALGPPQSSARMRRARKNKKDRPKEVAVGSSQDGASQQLDEVRPQHTESNSDTFTAASSMVTTMFNSFATSVSFAVNVKQDAERESSTGTKSHATEESAASTAEPQKTCLAVPMSQPPSVGRDRFARRRALQKLETRPATFGETTTATSTDMVASMVNSLAGLASFKFTTENADSEGEVHNAWGENDTEDNLLERVHDLEQARGIALGPPQSSARMRRARKNKKDRPKEVAVGSSQDGASQQLDEVRPQHTESNSDTFTAASSMVTTMFNSFATSVSFAVNVKQDAERESSTGTKSHATEESAASTAEPQKTCLAVPMSQPPSLGRERFARRRNRLDPPLSTCSNDRQSSLASASQGTESQLSLLSDTSSPGRRRERRKQHVSEEGALTSRSTLFDVAASSLAEFQRLFQSDEGETYCIWGPDDTPEQYQERLKALEASKEPASETSGTMLHHRLMRRRKKKQEALETKNQDTVGQS